MESEACFLLELGSANHHRLGQAPLVEALADYHPELHQL